MNDPHVVALNYVVNHGDSVDYSKTKPLALDKPEFRLTVADKKVRFEFKKHHATEESARESLADYIRAWEFEATLKYDNPDTFRLEFEKAEIIDRNPTPGTVRLYERVTITDSARHTLGVSKYPLPPTNITLNSDIETMHQRYMSYRSKHEPLQSMAYFCLSMLEDPPKQPSSEKRQPSKKRKDAAMKFGIDAQVLVEIGHLSSTRGGPNARKRAGTAKPLSPSEHSFLDQAVKAIIRRAAEREHAPAGSLPTISLSDLPSLEGESDPEDVATD